MEFLDNINNDVIRNQFNNLNLKNQVDTNKWLTDNKLTLKSIEGDYIISDIDQYFHDSYVTLNNFIKDNKEDICKYTEDGYKIYLELIENETEELLYKGLLNINGEIITIDDGLNNIITINNKELIVSQTKVLKILNKNPQYLTLSEFISKLNETTLFDNVKMRMTFEDDYNGKNLTIINGKIEDFDKLSSYQNKKIICINTIRF